jgi:WD40 repeat protein
MSRSRMQQAILALVSGVLLLLLAACSTPSVPAPAVPFTSKTAMGIVNVVAYAPNGKYLASGSIDGYVRVWNAHTGQLLLTYSGHSNNVWSLSWSPDSTRIASSGQSV